MEGNMNARLEETDENINARLEARKENNKFKSGRNNAKYVEIEENVERFNMGTGEVRVELIKNEDL